ncbi:hypothetical protein Tco_0458161 [Tanacetum coccineum]
MLLNVDRLQKQLDKDEFQEDGSMTAFWVRGSTLFSDTLLQHLGKLRILAERTRHQRQYDRRKSIRTELQTVQDDQQQIFTRDRFSPNKTSAVYEKTSSRSDLDIPNIHVCKQTLDLGAGTSLNGKKQQRIDLSAGALNNVKQKIQSNGFAEKDDISGRSHYQNGFTKDELHQMMSVHNTNTVTTSNELDLLSGPLFDEYLNGENQVVSKSFAVSTADASDKRQQQTDSTSSTSTLPKTVTADGNLTYKYF